MISRSIRAAGAARPARRLLIEALAVVLSLAPLGCVDETHDLQVQALGGEDPNVPTGPLHRPGQPCLVCHGGSGPAHLHLSIGGTVFAMPKQTTPAVGATVEIEDFAGTFATVMSNEAGNFFIAASDWQPTYPLIVPLVSLGANSQQMQTHIGRDGSCATCHFDPAGPTSEGHIYISSPDGGP
jgi:hypothetical protein